MQNDEEPSTVAVLRDDGKGRSVDEDIPIEDEKHVMANGYGASKWVSELMVRRAGRFGMPIQIMRLGRVVADSRSGQGRLDDVVALFLRACLRVGAYPDYSLPEKIIPVDYLSAAIVALAGDHTHTAVYHLIGTGEQDWCRLLPDYADCAAADMRKMSARDWVQKVKDASVPASGPLPFAAYFAGIDLADIEAVGTDAANVAVRESERTEIGCHRTVNALERFGIKEPKVSFEAWFSYLKRVFESEQRVFHQGAAQWAINSVRRPA